MEAPLPGQIARVFISYRRDDSAGHAGRVHDRLEREFGRDLLFMDVDAIPLGANFLKVLNDEVAKCDVLLAVIGPGWLDARDENGHRRLDSPNDFVRIEIAAALKRDIPVIPILLDGTQVPKAERLPDDIKELAFRNGLQVRHASFHNDMDKLIRGLRGHHPQQPGRPVSEDWGAKGREKSDATPDAAPEAGRQVEYKAQHAAGEGSRRAEAEGQGQSTEHTPSRVRARQTADNTNAEKLPGDTTQQRGSRLIYWALAIVIAAVAFFAGLGGR
jgi:TIR domain